MDLMIALVTLALLFLLCTSFVMYRLSYIKGYRAGAKIILKEWKRSLNEEEIENGDV